jgi:hypothetical protein
MSKFISLLIVFFLLVACTSEIDKAKQLGFSNPEQMKYLVGLGFKNLDEFKVAHSYLVASDTTKYAEAGLGLNAKMLGEEKQSDSGEYYEGPNGAWMSTDNSGAISMIGYSCIINKSKINSTIDGIGCDTNSNEIKKFTQNTSSFCSFNNYEKIIVRIKNNAFFIIENASGKLDAMGILKSPKSLIYSQTFYEPCDQVLAKVNKSKVAGFDSVYDMDEALKLGITNGAEWKKEQGKKLFKEKYASASNSLEKAMIVLVSTKKDLQDFKDNGGLNVLDNWRGYSVSSVEVEYTSGALTLLHLVADTDILKSKKPATFNNIKRDLIDECGTNWDSRGRSDVYWSASDFSTCEISEARSGGYHIVVSVKTK